ncbi:MAG: PCRF domain-containing protein, partial [Actinomycetota bacterium]|nr:PCRF domain-containing protein [Actinomycetota bacterium]
MVERDPPTGATVQLQDRLDEMERSYEELTAALADPAVLADSGRYAQVAKRHAEVSEVVQVHRSHRRAVADAQAARELAREATGADRDLLRAEAEDNDARAAALA